jgi:Putative transposase of IS4/5 family (DUF4096)
MASPLVPDELWKVVEPLTSQVKRSYHYPGCKRIDDRRVLTGIFFFLKTGMPWEDLPHIGSDHRLSSGRPWGAEASELTFARYARSAAGGAELMLGAQFVAAGAACKWRR